MTTIIGLCGSLRWGSFHAMLLRVAVDLPPQGTTPSAGTCHTKMKTRDYVFTEYGKR